MIRPIHLYVFRTVSLFTILVLTLAPIAISASFTSSLTLFPMLIVLGLVLMAIIEQKMLRKINWQKVPPIKAHKADIKPVRFTKHAGCKLLGLPCAA